MHGRCFGCGSTAHTKKDGNHNQDLCQYCKHTRHCKVICWVKLAGWAKSQKAAAVALAPEDNYEISAPDESPPNSENAKAVASASTILAQLVEQQKNLAKQITTW